VTHVLSATSVVSSVLSPGKGLCMTYFRYLVASGHLFGWAFALLGLMFMPFPWETKLITALAVTALGVVASLVSYRGKRRRPRTSATRGRARR